MGRTIVTAGRDYLDMDAYGGIVAYAELLRAAGKNAVAISTASWNVSVTPDLRKLPVKFSRQYTPQEDDEFVIVDLSDQAFFDTFVTPDSVVGIIDHHVGFEEFWSTRIGKEAHIEFIGAACTLVYELGHAAGSLSTISTASAKLLAAGIIDNTLNFKASLTTKRDIQAYNALKRLAGLEDTWAEKYLRECYEQLLENLETNLTNDTKLINYPCRSTAVCVGQMTVIDAQTVLDGYKRTIADTLVRVSPIWYANILDLSFGHSYFYCENKELQNWLSDSLGVTFKMNVAIADRLWLRKEIYKKVVDEENSTQ